MYTTTSGDSCNDRINDRRLRSGEVAVTEAVAVAVMRGGARWQDGAVAWKHVSLGRAWVSIITARVT